MFADFMFSWVGQRKPIVGERLSLSSLSNPGRKAPGRSALLPSEAAMSGAVLGRIGAGRRSSAAPGVERRRFQRAWLADAPARIADNPVQRLDATSALELVEVLPSSTEAAGAHWVFCGRRPLASVGVVATGQLLFRSDKQLVHFQAPGRWQALARSLRGRFNRLIRFQRLKNRIRDLSGICAPPLKLRLSPRPVRSYSFSRRSAFNIALWRGLSLLSFRWSSGAAVDVIGSCSKIPRSPSLRMIGTRSV